jgi:hypothetical protein
MMFEDETVYEGNFADAGVFSGLGVLTYANGDHLVSLATVLQNLID